MNISVIYYNLLTNKHFIFVKLKFKSINRMTLFSSLVKFSVEKKFWLNNQWPICWFSFHYGLNVLVQVFPCKEV